MDAVIIDRIARETAIPESSVSAAVALFEKGATGPFIVHYRKEATGGLDEKKVRAIQERMAHYKEVYDQRAALLRFLSEQGKLADELKARIESCFVKADLDDLHHQFRPRRRTRATEAIEKGLEPLAEYFWNQESDAWSVEEHINVFVDPSKGISTQEEALQGVVDIIAEWIWENFEIRKTLREMLWNEGFVVSTVVPAKVGQKTKYNMYYERREAVAAIPSHRVLAIRRGCKEGILVSSIEGDNAKALEFLLSAVIKDRESFFSPVLEAAARECYARILRPMIETEVRTLLKERADREAIKVFQENLASLLLSPPAGPIVVMGVDWGKGDECSVAVVNKEGAFLEGAKIRLAATPKTGPIDAQQKPAHKAAEPESAQIEQKTLTETMVEPPAEAGNSMATTPSAPPQSDEASSAAIASSGTLQSPHTNSAETSPPETPQTRITTPTAVFPVEPVQKEGAVSAETKESDSVQSQQIPFSPDASQTEEERLPEQTFQAEASDATSPDSSSDLERAGITEAPATESLTVPDAKAAMPEPDQNASGSAGEIRDPRSVLHSLITKYDVRAISIGTGTSARELEAALRRILAEGNLSDIMIAPVNDAGVAIYSSSRIAREEFPDWSPSARCAVSLARRLQDPLAELVKIDPKLIGVGQYQHDVDQKELHRGLQQTVQYCVNAVGVNANTAAESLLRYVSGLNEKLARRIVAYRNNHGLFRSRASVASAVGMDESIYEQSAAFLRIPDGENSLDRTALHPESYPIVEKMAATLGVGINDLIGNRQLISSLNLEDFVTDTVGMPTLNDMREELLRPGRDPRKVFKAPKFRPDVKEMSDLKTGMILEGTVTNVTNFGAFVDIGVRQDGLVHLSQMSNRFIRDPREAVKVGDVVQVKVISIEPETKRIGLSMKALLPAIQKRRRKPQRRSQRSTIPSHSTEIPAGKDAASPSAPADGASTAGARPKQRRIRNSSSRHRRRGAHRTAGSEASRNRKESGSQLPEPTLQEKIAILQSKFRRIN